MSSIITTATRHPSAPIHRCLSSSESLGLIIEQEPKLCGLCSAGRPAIERRDDGRTDGWRLHGPGTGQVSFGFDLDASAPPPGVFFPPGDDFCRSPLERARSEFRSRPARYRKRPCAWASPVCNRRASWPTGAAKGLLKSALDLGNPSRPTILAPDVPQCRLGTLSITGRPVVPQVGGAIAFRRLRSWATKVPFSPSFTIHDLP